VIYLCRGRSWAAGHWPLRLPSPSSNHAASCPVVVATPHTEQYRRHHIDKPALHEDYLWGIFFPIPQKKCNPSPKRNFEIIMADLNNDNEYKQQHHFQRKFPKLFRGGAHIPSPLEMGRSPPFHLPPLIAAIQPKSSEDCMQHWQTDKKTCKHRWKQLHILVGNEKKISESRESPKEKHAVYTELTKN